MAVIRQQNFLSAERVDTVAMRSVESAVANDFDLLAGRMLAGQQPLILKGFTVATTGTLGSRADLLQLSVAGGLLLHFGAAEAGTIFFVPDATAAETLSATNTKLIGAFTAGTTNYVGLDLRRTADSTTSDSAKFLDFSTNKEVSKTVPMARILDYRIVISTQPFSVATNVAPIAKVVTDSSNNIVSTTDARSMMFRLGAGSDTPNGGSSFPWPSRKENAITFSGSSAADPFSGGDKSIVSLKQWMDSMMTRVWEIGSGEYWYSATSRDNAKLLYGPIVSLTDNFVWTSGSSTLQWESMSLAFENSTVYLNPIADGSAVLSADGMCLYVDVVRGATTTLVPVVGTLTSLGSPVTPGTRYIIAWRNGSQIFTRDRGFETGRQFAAATTTTLGVVELNATPLSAGTPQVVTITTGGGAIIAASSGNTNGLLGTGKGTGSGVRGNGDAASNGNGVSGVGSGTGRGGSFIGGSGGGIGARGQGVGAAGVVGISDTSVGGSFFGGTNSAGVVSAGTGTGDAVIATGGTNSRGGLFTGGTTSNEGLRGQGGAPNGWGLAGQGVGTGYGVVGQGGATGDGGNFTGGATSGNGASGVGTGPGAGFFGTGGPTDGHGGLFVGGGGNGPGLRSTGGTTGNGVEAVAGTPVVTLGVQTGGFAVSSAGNIQMAGANPAPTDGFTNTITPINLPKAMMSVSSSTGTITLGDGFNVVSVLIAASTRFEITLATPMASATGYLPTISTADSAHIYNATAINSTLIYVFARTSIGGAAVNPSTAPALSFYLVVYGPQ